MQRNTKLAVRCQNKLWELEGTLREVIRSIEEVCRVAFEKTTCKADDIATHAKNMCRKLQCLITEKDKKIEALQSERDEVRTQLHLLYVFYLRSQWRETVKRAVQNWKVHQKEATIAALEDECEMHAQAAIQKDEQMKKMQLRYMFDLLSQAMQTAKRGVVESWKLNAKANEALKEKLDTAEVQLAKKDALLGEKDAANVALKDAFLKEQDLRYAAQARCDAAECDELRAQLHATKVELRELQEGVKVYDEEENRGATDEEPDATNEFEAQLADTQAKLALLKQENARLKACNSYYIMNANQDKRLKEKLDIAKQESDAANAQLAALKREVETAKRCDQDNIEDLTSFAEEFEALTGKLTLLQEEHAQYHHDETAYGAELAETQTNPAVAKGELAEANVELEQVCEIAENAQNYFQEVQKDALENVIQELETELTKERTENSSLRYSNKMLEYAKLSQGIENEILKDQLLFMKDQLLFMKNILAQIYILNKRTKYGTFQVPASTRSNNVASTRSNNVRAVILPFTIPPPKPVLGYLSPGRAKPTDQKPAEIPVCNTTRLRQLAWFAFHAAVLTAVLTAMFLFKTQLCGIAECFFLAAVVYCMFLCDCVCVACETIAITVCELVQLRWWLQGINASEECSTIFTVKGQ